MFNGGIVLREFVPLTKRGSDIRGLPLVEEYRLFYWKGELIIHPEVISSVDPLQQKDRWDSLAAQFKSPFLTLDVALLDDHSWTVVTNLIPNPVKL